MQPSNFLTASFHIFFFSFYTFYEFTPSQKPCVPYADIDFNNSSFSDTRKPIENFANETSIFLTKIANSEDSKKIINQSKTVTDSVTEVVKALKASDKTTKEISTANSRLNSLISDLEATEMFATAGSHDPETPDSSSYPAQRQSIVAHAKSIVEATKNMVAINNSDQDELCEAIRQNVDAAELLVDVSKEAAASLTSEYKQVQVVQIV